MKKVMCLAVSALMVLSVFAGCSKKVSVKLLPENADLEWAYDVVLEPDKAPFNLGGWLNYNEVFWVFEIKEEGTYEIQIECSRPGEFLPAWGTMNVYDESYDIDEEIDFLIEPTGKVSDKGEDWSVYKMNNIGSLELTPGKYTLSIEPNPDKDEEYTGTDYFINLRSVNLVKK